MKTTLPILAVLLLVAACAAQRPYHNSINLTAPDGTFERVALTTWSGEPLCALLQLLEVSDGDWLPLAGLILSDPEHEASAQVFLVASDRNLQQGKLEVTVFDGDGPPVFVQVLTDWLRIGIAVELELRVIEGSTLRIVLGTEHHEFDLPFEPKTLDYNVSSANARLDITFAGCAAPK